MNLLHIIAYFIIIYECINFIILHNYFSIEYIIYSSNHINITIYMIIHSK